jgi:hypothetical protein
MQALVYRFARGMQNFIYLIGDVETQQALVVDCCWDYEGIVKVQQYGRGWMSTSRGPSLFGARNGGSAAEAFCPVLVMWVDVCWSTGGGPRRRRAGPGSM